MNTQNAKSRTLTALEDSMLKVDAQICALTGISWEDLNALRFETAYQFMAEVLGVDEHGLEQMPQTHNFWHWWSREWLRVDELYLESLRYDIKTNSHFLIMPDRTQINADSVRRRLAGWEAYHEASEDNYVIDREVIHQTYHTLIKSFTR